MPFKRPPIFCILIAFLTAGCATGPLPPTHWTYEKDAVRIHIKADPKLNLDQGVPHTLMICLYQLKDPNAFDNLSEDRDGIYKLLDCNLFAPSVATAKRVIVGPGQDTTVTLDRAAGARYVAAAAGYYDLQKDRMIRLYDIPTVVESKGIINRTKISKPGPFRLEMELGPLQIKQARKKSD
jgi:type VI secretion system VasD/TssJ family lipoprotein